MPKITCKGVVTQKEGVSTQNVLGTPREPFFYVCMCFGIKLCLRKIECEDEKRIHWLYFCV